MIFRRLLFLIVFTATPLLWSQLEPKPKVHWELSFAVRAWKTGHGLYFNELVGTQAEAFAPDIEVKAIRNHLVLRGLFQFPTDFKGPWQVNDGVEEISMQRLDSELAVGWRFSSRKLTVRSHYHFQLLGGLKRLELTRDLLDTPVTDDIQRTYQGYFAGLEANLQGVVFQDKDWDLVLLAGAAQLEVDVSQRQVPPVLAGEQFYVFTEPYRFDSSGYFADLSLNIYLGYRLQWMIGYKIQNYQPKDKSITITTQLPDRAQTNTIRAPSFLADGLVTGFLVKF